MPEPVTEAVSIARDIAEPRRPVPAEPASVRTLGLADYVSLTQRIVIATILLSLNAAGVLYLRSGPVLAFDIGLGILVVVAVFGAVALLASDMEPRRVIRWVLLPDLVSSVLLIWATGAYQDPLYPWMIGLALIYGVGLEFRESISYSALVAVAYLVGHVLGQIALGSIDEYVLITFKALAIVVTAAIVGEAWRRQVAREKEAIASQRQYHELNQRLSHRLNELRAVSEITEIIHSTLDFEQVGQIVLEIVSKVIDLPASSLFVIDKRLDQTLYTASFGVSKGTVTVERDSADGIPVARPEDAFACTTVLDRGHLMVVLCAPAERLEGLSSEDRLVLAAVSNDLTVAVENSELYKLTKRLSITDELTGLYNYRYLLQRMDDEIERARRFGRSLSLLMVDADEFKRYNDTYGHLAGDAALAELARVLRTCVRDIDVVCRYGGEEFALLFPETDAEGAFVAAEKLRDAVATHPFPDGADGPPQRLTISIGLTTFPASAVDREGLLRQADDALYSAKRSGRNRVTVWHPGIVAMEPEVRPLESFEEL